ncbi:DUF3253 domain-containing protein [Streptomyces goshikiensis]|uniref:DUF3253 domain-containing protein n=1 Tax=Streptomyces goshikiensis TaxID=1942 RepID=UPI0036842534
MTTSTGRPAMTDQRLEQTHCGLTMTICSTDAARAVYAGNDEGWRTAAEPAHRAARRLVTAGEVEITQSARTVESAGARGPLRMRRRRAATPVDGPSA